MRFHLLGSSAGKPVPRPFCSCKVCRHARQHGGRDRRTRTSMNIYLGDDGPATVRYKVDLPSDTPHHNLAHGQDLTGLEHLLITHAHGDHLDAELLAFRRTAISGIDKMTWLAVYGSAEVEHRLRTLMENFEDYRIAFHCVEPFSEFHAGVLTVRSLAAAHPADVGSLNYVIEAGGQTVLLAWDTGPWPESTWQAVGSLRFDAVFAECTVLGPEGKSLGPEHHTVDTFLAMKRQMAQAGLIDDDTPFVTVHMGDNGLLTHAQAQTYLLPHGVTVGYDGLVVDLDAPGQA